MLIGTDQAMGMVSLCRLRMEGSNVTKKLLPILLCLLLVLIGAAASAPKSSAVDPNTRFRAAVLSGQIPLVRQMLAKGADVNAASADGVTPLHVAASTGNRQIVELLIAAGAHVNASDSIERTPLSIAIENGRADAVGLLLTHDARAGKPGKLSSGPKGIVFPKSPAPAKTLFHVNLLGAPLCDRLAVTILQGLVNREQPRIYVTQDPGWHTPALIPKWMDGLRAKGYSFVEILDPLSLFSTFARNVRGAVIYESDIEQYPAMLHKLNALTLYCALNDAVPLTVEMNARLRLPVLLDVRGMLNTGQDAYEWAYRDLWPKANHNLLAFICPSHVVLRDYLVANKVMPFWTSKEMDLEAERICFRFMDEAAPNSPVMGCWGGYAEQPAGRVDEPNLQQWSSQRGKFVVVSDGCFDLSVHSGLTLTKVQKPRSPRYMPFDPNKVYICLNFTDGDNIQYIQQYFCTGQWWGDPNRGKVPLAWSVNPVIVDLIPDLLEYLSATSTSFDELICSGSGVGIASAPTYAERCPDRVGIYGQYMKLTAASMKQAGFSSMHLCDSSGVQWSRSDFDGWAKALPYLDGILGDYSRMPGVDESNADFRASGIPVLRALSTPTGPMNGELLANAIRAATPKQRPAFMHFPLVCWFNSPSTVLDAVNILGPEYIPVTPSELFTLMRIPETRTIWFDFDTGAEGWGNASDMRDMSIAEGFLSAVTTGGDPYFVRGKMLVPASEMKQIRIRLKTGKGAPDGAQFFWVTDKAKAWDQPKCLSFPTIPDGKWHEYVVPISQNPEWKDTIIGLRLDPTYDAAGIPVSVDFIHGE